MTALSGPRNTAIPKAGAMTRERFAQLRRDGMADFTQRLDAPHNTRRATCRVCRVSLPRGEAYGYDEYMTDGYRFSRRYVCLPCKLATERVGA